MGCNVGNIELTEETNYPINIAHTFQNVHTVKFYTELCFVRLIQGVSKILVRASRLSYSHQNKEKFRINIAMEMSGF